ncbi:MAG: type IV pilus assembly protein PilM [Candidatus Yonathbacteria bacterium]|nr:type IV pilus assembly protein PilM [Candidatus Yonathbacteria bacterium]
MKTSLFYKLFPPPVFLRMPSVGFDISDQSIRFAELIETHKGFIIGKYGYKNIVPGIIEGGEIKNAEELRKILLSMHEEFNIDFANVSLPEQQAYLLNINVPKMKRSEIRESLELQLEEYVPISMGDATFDYDIVDGSEQEKDHLDLSLVAVPRKVAEGYSSVFEHTGITPITFEVEAQAIARAVIPRGDKGTYMIMDFGKTRTGISIVSEEIVVFTSTINIGGLVLTKAIEKQFGITTEEAEKIKKEQGFAKNKDTQEIFLALMSTISILKDEINKHYAYWNTHLDQDGKKRPNIEKVLLCGGDSNLVGFTDYLLSGLQTEIELANTMINVNTFDRYIPEIEFSDSLSYATAIGLALRPSE